MFPYLSNWEFTLNLPRASEFNLLGLYDATYIVLFKDPRPANFMVVRF